MQTYSSSIKAEGSPTVGASHWVDEQGKHVLIFCVDLRFARVQLYPTLQELRDIAHKLLECADSYENEATQ